MTKLEMQAMLLASEVENLIALNAPITSSLIIALNEFKKAANECLADDETMLLELAARGPALMVQTITPKKTSAALTWEKVRAIINSGN